MAEESFKRYVHSPAHLFRPDAVYFITAGTLYRRPIMHNGPRKDMVKQGIDLLFDRHNWHLIAWVILDNHYHMLARAPESGAGALARWVNDLHKFTAGRWNKEDRTPGRQVWHEYWDRCITSESSFYARINYIHWNPVKHGYADHPRDYPHGSYFAFFGHDERLRECWEHRYPWDRVSEPDDF